MNYTTKLKDFENYEDTEISITLILLIIFGFIICFSMLIISFPNCYFNLCKKNKIYTINNLSCNTSKFHYTEIYFDNFHNKCSICTNNLNFNDDIIITDCKHYFHKKCLQNNFNYSHNCPNCRQYIYDVYNVNLI